MVRHFDVLADRLATTLASLLEGVKKGDLNMTVSAGLCYYHGRGTTVDTAYAIELLTKAAGEADQHQTPNHSHI